MSDENDTNHPPLQKALLISLQPSTVLDAIKGYHECPLDADSQLLTMFITPFGRFKYLCAPYEIGISSISEHCNCQMAEALEGLSRFC